MLFLTSRHLQRRSCASRSGSLIVKLDAAPYDDDELGEEDLKAIQEARSEPGIPWSRLRRSCALAERHRWRIEIRRSGLKSLRRLGRRYRGRIDAAIDALPEGDDSRRIALCVSWFEQRTSPRQKCT
jgi:hypothetical protein